jgi:hypothetical protein
MEIEESTQTESQEQETQTQEQETQTRPNAGSNFYKQKLFELEKKNSDLARMLEEKETNSLIEQQKFK